ncbi:hypothetical protein [Owenweeksia hongkongensis]|uniref:hypothetical protein n=1 Tax=Owenweeksia hongkongensis TaxID=253245 RepID=UPI003A8DB9F6
MNRVFFDLPAVIKYDNIPLRECLMEALRTITKTPIDQQDLSWNENCSGVLINVFRNNLGRFPSNEEYDEVRALFRENLKKLFIEEEEMFDVWPGVQNVFESIEKRKDWEYYLVSDYWEIGTRFILDSCGVHSGSLKMCTADNALSGSDAIQRILNGKGKSKTRGEAFLVVSSHTSTAKHIAIDQPSLTIIDHTSITSSDDVYPRFSELFAVEG